jgi:hypothetical protein
MQAKTIRERLNTKLWNKSGKAKQDLPLGLVLD